MLKRKRIIRGILSLVLLVFSLSSCFAADANGLGDMYVNNIYPSPTDTYNLGSPMYEWNTGFFKSIYLGGTLLTPTGVAPTWGSITGTLSSQGDLDIVLSGKQDTSAKGSANGYAPLDANSKVPIEYLGSLDKSGGSKYLRSDQVWASVTVTELDPIFSASVAAGISSGDITNWNGKLSAVTGTNLDNVFTTTGLLKRTGVATYTTDTSTYLTGNQSITWTPSGDISDSASGATSITPSITVTGIQGKAISLATGFLKYSGSAWMFDNSTYETTTALNTWAGNTSINSVGTVGTGTWNGGVILGQYGGTGIVNTGDTINLGGNILTGGNVTFSGAYTFTGTLSNNTAVTFPTSGTLFSTTTEVPNANIPNGINDGTSTADFSQSMSTGTYYYIPNSKLTMPASAIAGMNTSTRMTWRLYMKKTAAGTAAFYICIYRGVNGTIADARDVAQSIGVATAALDNMVVDVQLTVTTTGASGAYHWSICAQNKAATATGFGVATGAGQFSGNVSSVAMNTASLIFGIGVMGTTGTTAITVPLVEAQVFNMD
jgi:hypothetical protein